MPIRNKVLNDDVGSSVGRRLGSQTGGDRHGVEERRQLLHARVPDDNCRLHVGRILQRLQRGSCHVHLVTRLHTPTHTNS